VDNEPEYILVGANKGPCSPGEKEYTCYKCGGSAYLHDKTASKLDTEPNGAIMCIGCLLKIADRDLHVMLPDVQEVARDFEGSGMTADRATHLRSVLLQRLLKNNNRIRVDKQP